MLAKKSELWYPHYGFLCTFLSLFSKPLGKEYKMRLKEGVIIQELDGKYVMVDGSDAENRFHGIVNMNKTAAFVAKQLQNEVSLAHIVQAMTEKYDVSEEVAEANAKRVIDQLQSAGLLV